MSSNEKFEVLETSIPKTPQTWTGEDVQKWLKILQMERYTDQFRKFKFPDNPKEEMAIDGLLILDLTEEDLSEELNISTKLHRRKILKGIFCTLPKKTIPQASIT
jgi:hypothetical protein